MHERTSWHWLHLFGIYGTFAQGAASDMHSIHQYSLTMGGLLDGDDGVLPSPFLASKAFFHSGSSATTTTTTT